MGRFPNIGYAVSISIPQFIGCNAAIAQCRPRAGGSFRFHICRQVYQAGNTFRSFCHTTDIGSRTVSGFFYNTYINGIPLPGTSRLIQYEFISLFCTMSSDNACIQRFGQTHFLFHFLCECIVTRSIIDLPVKTFGPVILGYFLISFDDIAVYIEFPPYVFHWFPGIGSAVCIHAILLYAYSYGGNTVADRAVFRCSRSWFIIIVHNIDTHAFSAIATVSGPVVEYVIPHIHVFAFLSKWTRSQTGYTTFVMCQQIMMKRSFCSSPDRSIEQSDSHHHI